MFKKFKGHRVASGTETSPKSLDEGIEDEGVEDEGADLSRSVLETRLTAKRQAAKQKQGAMREVGGPEGPEPTRYGDWEIGGRAVDF